VEERGRPSLEFSFETTSVSLAVRQILRSEDLSSLNNRNQLLKKDSSKDININ
jgi:hypothetical protein